MKVLAYCTLHYGAPYLAAAVESLYDQVDHIVILYTSRPSQGFSTNLICPDTPDELQALIAPYADKVTWHEGVWNYEGEHCEAVNQFSAGYDWAVRFDSDEVFQPGAVRKLLGQAEQTNARIFRTPFIHFWRSFGKVCRDGQMPERIMRLTGGDGYAYLDSEGETTSVLHFGYAQPTKYIAYKMEVQAHRNEWRGDWFDTKWLANAQIDVHPVVFDFWKTEDFNKAKLPDVLKKHLYFDLEVIE